ncbi:cupredoxin domain-containing protein [Anaeromyxobacter paludicola]|uniref:EfeO-type cupredoxin-like domain-containing protein n=1 Tax=Anaeromyxobacter paludicola TaxID=2918171 RepID=A0ABN6N7J3_9BACT|nr:cupredoxin domain-containing protein [Anaeromyxobacter paludicola]BDG07912.1 hypothetical protein AMPC_10250 [Anaeromyxobacter paludicola]
MTSIHARRLLLPLLLALTPFAAAHAQHRGAPPPRPNRAPGPEEPPRTPPPPPAERRLEVKATEKGFEPALIVVRKGERIRLEVTRVSDAAPAKDLVVDAALFVKPLPVGKPVSVAFVPDRVGDLRFTDKTEKVVGILRVEE